MKIFIETERLILREIVPGDEHGLYELDSDPEVHRYLGRKPITTMQQAAEVVSFIRKQYEENGIGRWAAVEKESNRFIGWAGLKLVKELNNGHINYYDLGYRLIRKYWGKGFATEAALASRNYAFEELNLQEIFACADAENKGSNRVLVKCGMQLQHTFEEEGDKQHWYALSRETWSKARI